MGIINKIYSKKNIIPSSKIYSDHLTIERTENFHIHIRNLRIELDRNEYKSLSLAFIFAYIKWMLFGFKKNKPADNDILFKSKLPKSPSILNGFTTSDELRVELQQWADYVQIHYKNLRLDFTVDEAHEFISSVSDSLDEIEKNKSQTDRVRRVGFSHKSVPNLSLLEGDEKNSEFWTKWEETKNLKNPFLSSTLGKDGHSIEEPYRKDGTQNIFSFHLDELYFTSLYEKTFHNEFGYADNKFLPLLFRKEFATLYLKKGHMSEEEIIETNYFKLISKNFSEKPRDGSKNTIYANPMNQAKRFISLINSMKTGIGRNTKEFDEKFGEAIHEFGASAYNYKSGEKFSHIGKISDGEKMITCMVFGTSIHVKDGLHRIAILKSLKDLDLLNITHINCYLINPRDIYGNSFKQNIFIVFKNMMPRKVFGLGLISKFKKLFRKF
tara:strand:+ start:555 stop:1874 length:1320 start_codon:yes stop_codon:yes gene_type:complete